MVYGHSEAIRRVAQRIGRVPDTSPSWCPRPPRLTLHMGTLEAVDIGTNTAHFGFNDPSGLIIPGVRYLRAYSADNPPRPGDVAWACHYGTDLMILGQHLVPTSTVIVP